MPDTPVMDRLVQRSLAGGVPLSVHFDLTYRCNERCVHCYLDHEDYGELGTEEIESILGELAAAGTLMLTFSGGELFLRGDLFELIEHARKLHFDIGLKSNALLVTRERAARLRELGIRRVQVSVYSSEAAVHDAITKVHGSFERTLHGIRLLKAEGLRVKIACPLMRLNLAGAAQVQALAEDLDVPYVFDMTITPKLDGDMRLLALRNSAKEMLPVLQSANLWTHSTDNCSSGSAGQHTGSVVSSEIEGVGYDDVPCSAGHNSCYISPYGDVYPCVQMPIAAGNLRKQRFREIWNSSQIMKRIREVRESDLPICSLCDIRQYCERCPGLAHMEGGDVRGPYERACELAEMKARAAGVRNPVSALHLRANETPAGSLPSIAQGLLVQIAATDLN
jgi:radical SAM protein with 4Fe4S-binding SPASM domain